MKKRKIVGSAVVGNIVEYYDFGIYAVFTPIIGALFFPQEDAFVQTLLTLGVFALGFLMRPLGGVVFGHIGDKFGRKISLTSSIIGMALCTLFIGLLPSYESIGIIAPILLLIVRMMQGLCVGGEGAGTAIFVLEHLEGYRPGLIGSIVMASNMVGTLLAVFVGIIITHFYGNDEMSWRYGFFFGAFMGIIGLYMRHHVTETPVFEERKNANKIVRTPFLDTITKHFPRVVVVAFLGGITAAVAYTIRGYLNVFFQNVMGYTATEALYFKSFALFILIVFLPFFGLIADRVGYRKFLYIICYVVLLTAAPIYMMLANPDKIVAVVFVGLLGIGALAAAICAPAYPYAIRAFEVELRFSGVAFSWNLGIALFGGTTPAISIFLSEKFGNIAPAYYLMAMALGFMLVSFATRKHKH